MRLIWLPLLLVAYSAWSLPGDLDLDGDVDFEDFFRLADNFGKTGPPDTIAIVVYDTVSVEAHQETLRVSVFDTLQIETVYDTVTVEFVLPPSDVNITDTPDLILQDHNGQFSYLHAELWGSQDRGALTITTYSREPIDSDDRPWVYVNYDEIPVTLSWSLRYVPLTNDGLETVAGDTVEIARESGMLRSEDGYSHASLTVDLDDKTETLRFPSLANTRGNLIADMVLRTPIQGDYSARAVDSVTFSSTGKLIY